MGGGSFLVHGKEWKNHKYVRKERTTNGYWRYYYGKGNPSDKDGFDQVGTVEDAATYFMNQKVKGELSDEESIEAYTQLKAERDDARRQDEETKRSIKAKRNLSNRGYYRTY